MEEISPALRLIVHIKWKIFRALSSPGEPILYSRATPAQVSHAPRRPFPFPILPAIYYASADES
ncbi:hypothetical protein TMatcc_008105 [Talaromyces marneffei ATCC 18224]